MTADSTTTELVVTPSAPTTERDFDGRWKPGQSGNPAGRPPSKRQRIAALQQELEEVVRQHIKPERVAKIIDKMCKKAEAGDVRAAQTIFSYVLTKPSADSDDSPKTPGGIVIRIENATFKAQQSLPPVPAIEGEYSELPRASKAD